MREPIPRLTFGVELFLSRACQLVEPRATIILRDAPPSLDPALGLEATQRRIERPIVHVERSLRHDLDRLREIPAVRRARPEELEHNQVERALEKVGLGRHWSSRMATGANLRA